MANRRSAADVRNIQMLWGLGLLGIFSALAAPATAPAQEVVALAGGPYGVAEFTWRGDAVHPVLLENRGMRLSSPDGRARWPVVQPRLRDGGVLREALGISSERPRVLTVQFLFTGTEPFEVIWDDGTPRRITVVPRRPRGREYDRLLARWWGAWQQSARSASTAGDQILSDYLTWFVARELGFTPPNLAGEAPDDEALRTLQRAFGGEAIRRQVRQATLHASGARRAAADQPLPAATVWPPLPLDEQEPPAVEKLAQRVPPECLYIRFGSFTNYLWFNRLLTENGGDLATLVTPTPLHRPSSERLQGQLGLKQSALAEVLGPAVISDVALIGYDLYFADGAAMGILFQARSGLLANDLIQQRQAALAAEAERGATEETLTIAGHKVSFVSTPDNRLRSYYVADGEFHLVTTCRHLVERFLEVGKGEASLGSLPEFHHARRLLPLERDDTIFLYFSTPFFQNLVTPQYQIELERRFRSATDMQLYWIARQLARARGVPSDSVFDLIERGLLPPTFVDRPEGGEVLVTEDTWIDTLRGARGTFTPIPDMKLSGATRAEVDAYVERARYYETNWKQFDPLMVAVQRTALNDQGLERLAIEAHISPLDESKYGRWLSLLGPPTTHRIATAPGDVIAVQAHVQGGLLSGTVPPHVLFLGIQDVPPPPSGPGLLAMLNLLRSTPGYLGAWPKPGFLDWLPLGLGGGAPDPAGYSRLPLGLWRRQWADLSVLSFQYPLLDFVTPHLKAVETEDPAQLRLYVGDISQSQLRDWLTRLAGQRALELTRANARALHRFEQYLDIPRPEARQAVEQLLDAELVSPLGGTYALAELPRVTPFWASTAQLEEPSPLAAYEAPLLAWFRGLSADVTRTPDGLLLRAELDMQRSPSEPKAELPLFNFFRTQRPSTAPPPPEPPAPAEPDEETKSREF